MLKNVAGNGGAIRVADVAFAASRQVWLAGLGAATMTRQWARNDAGEAFRTLVKEGSTVEARALRRIGRQVDSSIVLATTALSRARSAAQATLNGVVKSVAAIVPGPRAARVTKRPVKAAVKKPHAARRSASRKARRSKRSV
jgi:hypothetical protein